MAHFLRLSKRSGVRHGGATRRRAIAAAGLVSVLAVVAVGRATIQEIESAPGSGQESPYYDEALGPYTREVRTSSERAQASTRACR